MKRDTKKRTPNGLSAVLSSGSGVFQDPSSLRLYAFDQGEVPAGLRNTLLPDSEPDLVVQPGSLEDLQACVRYAGEKNIPLVPRGASTFGMGGAVPHQGGILLDFSTYREIHEFDSNAQTVRVSAGCRWSDVSQFLDPLGMDLYCYPTSWFSTVGGWTSTGGIGIGCTSAGNFHELVRAITVVKPDGEVKHLTAEDPELRYFLGTEGQMGAVWDVTFSVRKKATVKRPLLLLFDSPESAVDCARELLSRFHPYHLKFLSSSRMHEIHHLLREEHPQLPPNLRMPEQDALLLCMEDSAAAEDVRRWTEEQGLQPIADFRAHYLWRERMFPLRVKRVAPGLLASEVVLPVERVAEYAEKARELALKFHVRLAFECYFLNDGTALTLPVYTFDSAGFIDEAVKSALAFVLTQAGIGMGGRPYGIGIWNSPFARRKLGAEYNAHSDHKRRIDPSGIFNPGKFFELSFRAGTAGKFLALPLHASLIPIWTKLAPFAAPFLTRDRRGRRPSDLLLENEELCSKCGSCIPVCPAYIETRDERTTARGKLQLGKWILGGGETSAEEANALFLCMHCGACTDVCQSRLNLVPVWDELEKRVEAQFGMDRPRVAAFVESVQKKRIMEVPYALGAQVRTGHKSK